MKQRSAVIYLSIYLSFFLSVLISSLHAQSGIFDRPGLIPGHGAYSSVPFESVDLIVDVNGYTHQYSTDLGIINWDRLRQAFVEYRAHQCEKNAKAILDCLPMRFTPNQIGNKEKAHIEISESAIFDTQVLKGMPYLPEAAFRLLNYIEGAAQEEMEDLVQQLAYKQPLLYLQLLDKYEGKAKRCYLYGMEGLWVTSGAGPEEEESIRVANALIKIHKEKIESLSSVTAPSLMKLRNDCIHLLENEIARLENISGRKK